MDSSTSILSSLAVTLLHQYSSHWLWLFSINTLLIGCDSSPSILSSLTVTLLHQYSSHWLWLFSINTLIIGCDSSPSIFSLTLTRHHHYPQWLWLFSIINLVIGSDSTIHLMFVSSSSLSLTSSLARNVHLEVAHFIWQIFSISELMSKSCVPMARAQIKAAVQEHLRSPPLSLPLQSSTVSHYVHFKSLLLWLAYCNFLLNYM